jgi:predicted ATP-binding protein involved in virulence
MATPFIEEIEIRNFTCFENLKLNLKAGVNLVYGINGTGKTALLEALSISADCFLATLPFAHVKNTTIKRAQIRLATHEEMLYPERQLPAKIAAKGTVMGVPIVAPWVVTNDGHQVWVDASQLEEIAAKAKHIVQEGQKEKLPLVLYLAIERLMTAVVSIEKSASQKDSDSENENSDGFDDDEMLPTGRFWGYWGANLGLSTRKEIKAWIRDQERLAFVYQKELKSNEPQAPHEMGTLLYEELKKLVLRFFPEWRDLYFYESELNKSLPKGIFVHQKNGERLPISHLSAGYRNVLWTLLDIGWRCVMLNPFLQKDVFKETEGLVLIDEIDLHLHPQWQRRIVDILQEAFPKIQFVLTTHSPLVLASKGAHVILLGEDHQVVTDINISGMKPSRVLSDFMGVPERPEEISSAIQAYFELIEAGKGHTAEAIRYKKMLEENLSTDDPIFEEARILLTLSKYQ